GAVLEEIEAEMWSVGMPLRRWPALQWALLAMPLLGLGVLAAARHGKSDARTLDSTTAIVVTMFATVTITVLGDGLADTAKQGHLVINAAMAWVIVMLIVSAVRSLIGPTRTLSR
ncbi:MAG: hypothetical protein ABI650_05445, partial [Dokdonella sp.]